MWLILQSVVSAGLAVFALLQDPPAWLSMVRGGSLGAWGSFVVYASYSAISAILYMAPRIRRKILSIFPDRLASVAADLFTVTGVLVVSSMVGHALTGNLYSSP